MVYITVCHSRCILSLRLPLPVYISHIAHGNKMDASDSVQYLRVGEGESSGLWTFFMWILGIIDWSNPLYHTRDHYFSEITTTRGKYNFSNKIVTSLWLIPSFPHPRLFQLIMDHYIHTMIYISCT